MNQTPEMQAAIGTLQDLEDALRREAAGKLLQADATKLAIAKLSENEELKVKVAQLDP